MFLSTGIDIQQAHPVFRVGETPAIVHRVNVDDPGDSITAATITIYSPAGTAIVTDAAVTASPGAQDALSHTLSYLFTVGANAAGEYTYRLKYTRGSGEVRIIPGDFTIRPATSLRDRYVRRVAQWLRRGDVQPLHRPLTEMEALAALDGAALAYSRYDPQEQAADIATIAGGFEYALPVGWVNGFSQVLEVVYPWDAALQARPSYFDPWVRVDELRGKWWFVGETTAVGVARFLYTIPQVMSDTSVTLPAHAFESVTQYAAGLALETLANEAGGDSMPQIGDGAIVNFRDQQAKYREQAEAMLRAAERTWRRVPDWVRSEALA